MINTFKVGDRVLCMDAYDSVGITHDKVYEVSSYQDESPILQTNIVYIVNDDRATEGYFSRRFVLVENFDIQLPKWF